jgi:hypothetical protein
MVVNGEIVVIDASVEDGRLLRQRENEALCLPWRQTQRRALPLLRWFTGFENERGFLGVGREIADLHKAAFAGFMRRASGIDNGGIGARLTERPPLNATLV